MKKLHIRGILVAVLLSAPLMAATPTRYPVRLDVVSDDSLMKTRIASAAARELRKLGDIDVGEDKPAVILHIIAIRSKNKGGAETGFAFALTVTYPGADAEHYVDSMVLINSDLDDACRDVVAYFDTGVLAQLREYIAKQAPTK